MDIETRKATPSDFDLTFELKKSAGGQYIKEVFGWDEEVQIGFHRKQFIPSKTELIIKDGKEIGWISVINLQDSIKIEEIYVIPKYQNQGIGSYLVKKILMDAESRKLHVQLRVFKINPAVKLYERLGFKICDEDGPFYFMMFKSSS